ncbi:YppF family protein [Ectobacillus sp. sgz5001026]|uniref:YppF family protein n=1 Tax=Ectobacillus sp. sgz5001026 TaxID=3242473 RepID=UPI0036D36E3F
MTLGELRTHFISLKQYEPTDLNMLLDFAGQRYLQGSICISEYRSVIRELEAYGATKPDYNTGLSN